MSQQPPGLFISFEGIDGAGKSSHIEALADQLRHAGRRVTVTREPGGTPLAERLRDLVLRQSMDGLTEAMLVFAARRDHLVQVIMPALQRGDVVLSDRFTDSSFAYQGGGQGLALVVLEQLERWVQTVDTAGPPALVQPDLTLWFDLPPAQAAARLAQVRAPDRFEVRGEAFFIRVREAYAARARAAPQRFVQIDAAADRGTVWQAVSAAVRGRGWMA
jgi:dTMP kinase